MKRFDASATMAAWKSRALGSTALTLLLATTAQAAPPAAGSLPGAFSTNSAGVTYTGTSATAATIATVGGANVLQFGGSALANKIPAPTTPSGINATNPGFSIGSGANLTINGGASSVLVNDLTGSPSQIFGTLSAGTLGGPLYVSNTSGVIVGPAGTITAPAAGVGLLGYAVDSASFAGTLNVNNATAGTGTVTVSPGATITGGPLLVATNGTVNIGAVSTGTNNVVVGFNFTTGAGSVTPTATTALNAGSSSVVNFTPAAGGATLTVNQLDAGGTVTNGANLLLPLGATLNVAGLFTNNGVLDDNDDLGANQLAGGLANNGVINEQQPGDLRIMSTKGNVQSLGALNLSTNDDLKVSAANIDIEGSVQVGGKALSSKNALFDVDLKTTATPAPQNGGVIDLAASLFFNGDVDIEGNAIRILSGGSLTGTTGSGGIFLGPGTNAAGVPDPFKGLTSLGYVFSMFPGTAVTAAAGSDITVENPAIPTTFATASGLNLNGQLSATTINVVANNINSGTGLAGGFSVPNGGTLDLTFFGNVNNPGGAAANGSTAFQFNFIGVTVGPNGAKAGTANITLNGPSFSGPREQFVNLLVNGNAQLADGSANVGSTTLTKPTLPTAVLPAYANNHLVVTATGNIGFDPNVITGDDTFYWPGLVFLTSGATASNPTLAPNTTASIALGDTSTSTSINFNNLIPGDLTKPSIGGQIGGGGVHYLTNNLNITVGKPTSTTTISNNSFANFLNAAIASSFFTVAGPQFLGGTISSSVVNVAPLPQSDFQP